MARKTPTVETRKIGELTPDERNANRGTERGTHMIGRSLERHGTGRSILVDKHGRIIAGNKTHAKAGEMGIEDVLIIASDGTKLIAVMRTDLDLETDPEAQALAIADNRTALLDIDLDPEAIARLHLDGVDVTDYFRDDELQAMLGAIPSVEFKEYDESVVDDVKYCECPSCGHKWPK